MYGIC